MHALSIAQSMIQKAVTEAQRANAKSVKALHVKLGPRAFVEADELTFCIQAAATGTIAEGAQVIVEPVERGGIALDSIDVSEEEACA